MAKRKTENNREAMYQPVSRSLRSRKRGYPAEKMTEDDHQSTGEANTEDALLQCLESTGGESAKKYNQPLESPSPTNDQHCNEIIGEPETLEVALCDPKRQIVISLPDCTQENKQTEMDKMSSECETLSSSNKHTNVNGGSNHGASEDEMCAKDKLDHNKETNREVDEVHQMSKESVMEGSAKRRRRMGMCQLSEKERSQFFFKCSNRVECDVKHVSNTDVAKEENGPSAEVMSSHQEEREMMQQGDIVKLEANQNIEDDREETVVEAPAAHGTNIMCEAEMHISEDDIKEGFDIGEAKHRPHKEIEPQRTKPGCHMTVSDAALTVCESGINQCQDHDQISGIHPPAEELITRTEPEEQLTVLVCDVSSPNLDKGDPSQKPHSNAKQLLTRFETDAHVTLPHIADSVCEFQIPESKTNTAEGEGPPSPDQTAALPNTNENKHLNEHEPEKKVEATNTEMHKQNVENISSNGDGNFRANLTEETTTEMDLPLLDTESKTTVENINQAVGDDTDLSHSSFSKTAAKRNSSSMGNSQVMNGSCEQSGKPDSSSVTMGPRQCDFNDLPGPCSLDYVSDSQLNTIVMTEQVTAAERDVYPEFIEDGTDLICGLIRELSSLNRTVMATHRELENLRRRGKNSRNTIR